MGNTLAVVTTSCRCPGDRLAKDRTHSKESITDSETTKPVASSGRIKYNPEKWQYLQPETRNKYMALDLISQNKRSSWEYKMLLEEKKNPHAIVPPETKSFETNEVHNTHD